MQNKKLKKTYDILLIGHVSKDIIIVKGRTTKTLGGALPLQQKGPVLMCS